MKSRSHLLGPITQTKGIIASRGVCYADDFLGAGAVVIPAAASAESGADWVKKIVGAAPPTVAGVANRAGGAIACTLTSAAQKQDAALYHNDQLGFRLTDGGFFMAIARVPVLPTLVATLNVMLASAWADDPQTITYLVGFDMAGSGEIFVNCDDNVTDSRVTSGITLVANDSVALGIDFNNLGDIRFYVAKNPTIGRPIQWSRVASTTTFAWAATAANSVLQPFASAYKASGAGVGTLEVDYIGLAIDRANY